MTTVFIPLKRSVQLKIPEKSVEFSGALGSSPHTPNSHTMTLHVTSCPDIKKGEKAKVTVDILELDREFIRNNKKVVSEGSDDDLLATFEGYLENRGDHTFVFSDMKPTEEVDLSKRAFLPYFYLSFAGEWYSVDNTSKPGDPENAFLVIVGLNKEENEGNVYEIGFTIRKDGIVIGSSGKTASLLDGEYSTFLPLWCFEARTKTESAGLACTTYALGSFDSSDFIDEKERTAFEASTTRVYGSTTTALAEKKLKTVDAILGKIDKLVKTSKNPYFQNIQAVNDYYQKLTIYKGHIAEYHQMQKSTIYTWKDMETKTGILYKQAHELNELEEKIADYLNSAKHPPVAYKEQIERYARILKRTSEIEEFLNHPVIQVMGLLPGAGVVTGSLKLLQGKKVEGFIDIFGSIITYGSFIKLSRVARAYKRTSKNTVELLYSYRYRNLVSQITTDQAMRKITSTSLGLMDEFLGKLFSTVDSFVYLKGAVDDIALLHRNRKVIVDAAERAIKGIRNRSIYLTNGYLNFIDGLGNTEQMMEFFAWVRLTCRSYSAGKDAYDSIKGALGEVKQLLGHTDVPGIDEFDHGVIDKTLEMFKTMEDNDINIDEIISESTISYPSNSAIVEQINTSNRKNDEFNLHVKADVRYRNTYAEMMLALDDITVSWEKEKADRDNWVKENWPNYTLTSERMMWKNWVKIRKACSKTLEGSLETRIKNFNEKIKGQIEFRERLKNAEVQTHTLTGLESAGMCIDKARDGSGRLVNYGIFDFDIDEYIKEALELIDAYY